MSGDALVFPSLEWLQALQQLVNADSEFRNLGSVDTTFGIKAFSEVFIVTFRAFQCEAIRAGTDDDLFEVDFTLEMEPDQWQEMIENIKENGAADLNHTLNTLDLRLPGGLASNATGEQYQLDLFFRYNESLQRFFDLSAQLDTVFRDGAAT
jgi:hypothetical protein